MRIYAELPDRKKFLYTIRCDGGNCGEEIKPNPNISESGCFVMPGELKFVSVNLCV